MATLVENLRVPSGPRPVGSEPVSPFAEVDQVLDCGMRPTASNYLGSENGAKNTIVVKQYLVKWKGLSYLHCSWVPDKLLKKAFNSYPELKTKIDDFHFRRDLVGENLVASLPERTTVDRICASREGDDGKEYLVKYNCGELYWESESDISTFQNEIQKFNDDVNTVCRYWEWLEKDKNEVQQAQQLSALGKRKRGCNKVPKPLMEGEGKSLKVLGFSKRERKTFEVKLMRLGVGNFDWEEFLPFFKRKTYAEIHAYGMLFLNQIVEDREDNSPTYSDGVPKGDAETASVLKKVAAMMLIKEKCKFLSANPTKRIFDDHFYKQYPTLEGRDKLDKLFLRGVSKHGYQNWMAIVHDKEFGIEKLISEEWGVPFPYYGSAAAQQARLSQLESGLVHPENNEVVTYKVMCSCFSDHVRKRVHEVLVKVLTYEFAEKYHEKIRAVQVETKAKLMDTMKASFVVIVKEMLGRLSETNRSLAAVCFGDKFVD